jgi:hypothetical protein
MRLTAKQQLTNTDEYGTVIEGQSFEASEQTARKLIARGLAYETKVPTYETAVVRPETPGVSAREPFRHVPDTDPEPPAMAAVRIATSAVPDVQEQGNTGRRGRPRRAPSDT